MIDFLYSLRLDSNLKLAVESVLVILVIAAFLVGTMTFISGLPKTNLNRPPSLSQIFERQKYNFLILALLIGSIIAISAIHVALFHSWNIPRGTASPNPFVEVA